MSGMSGNGIGWAVEQMRHGKMVRRSGWNGKGMWIALSTVMGRQEVASGEFWSNNARKYAQAQGGYATVLPCVIMKTATGEILLGWLCSQTDLLAIDWEIAD